jgi:hypothetical protein
MLAIVINFIKLERSLLSQRETLGIETNYINTLIFMQRSIRVAIYDTNCSSYTGDSGVVKGLSMWEIVCEAPSRPVIG